MSAAHSNDLALLGEWNAGNRKSGEILCQRYLTVAYRFFCNKLSRAEDVAELVGDTFLELLESRARPAWSPEKITSFRAYLLGIAKFVLFAYLRRHYTLKRGAGLGEAALENVSLADLTARNMSSLLNAQRECSALLQALRALPLGDQMLIEAKYFEYLGDAEIVSVLGIPATTLRRRQISAMERLQRQVQAQSTGPASIPPDQLASVMETWFDTIRAHISAHTAPQAT